MALELIGVALLLFYHETLLALIQPHATLYV